MSVGGDLNCVAVCYVGSEELNLQTVSRSAVINELLCKVLRNYRRATKLASSLPPFDRSNTATSLHIGA